MQVRRPCHQKVGRFFEWEGKFLLSRLTLARLSRSFALPDCGLSDYKLF